jgi:hypothetical protein
MKIGKPGSESSFFFNALPSNFPHKLCNNFHRAEIPGFRIPADYWHETKRYPVFQGINKQIRL